MPAVVDVFQDAIVFRRGVALAAGAPTPLALTSDGTGHYYQVRTQLPLGNLAVSNAVWVPSDRILTVAIDALPWANVTLRNTAAGSPVAVGPQATPFAAALPPGPYQLHFENGGVTPPMDQVIEVRPDNRTFRFTMPGFDAARTARDLSNPDTRR